MTVDDRENMHMTCRDIVILGSTGSIGCSALDVIEQHPECFRVRALAAYQNVKRLAEQYRKHRPELLCVVDESKASELRSLVAGEKVEIIAGEKALLTLARLDGADIVLNAVVGSAGFRASYETVKQGKQLALANKESLVAGGPLFAPMIKDGSATVLPIDSEHSAIWQCLNGEKRESIRQIILTSSGGPFRNLSADKFDAITVEQALAHPTWKMGNKITIDSATLANKGLEVIEAVTLFLLPVSAVKVVIHPQSIIHSMVEFVDSSTMAQLSNPDMRLPISYALFYPQRIKSDFGRIDWSAMPDLTFDLPDFKRFPALRLALESAQTGGTAPAVFNAANEVAVTAFLDDSVRFTKIADIIDRTLQAVPIEPNPGLEDIVDSDSRARHIAKEEMEKIA